MRSVTNVLAAVFLATTLTVSLSGFASAVHPEEAQRVEATQQANEATTVPPLKPRAAPTWHDYGSRYQWICYLQYDVTSMSKCRGGTLVIWDKTLKKRSLSYVHTQFASSARERQLVLCGLRGIFRVEPSWSTRVRWRLDFEGIDCSLRSNRH